jgi:hypothetical protein
MGHSYGGGSIIKASSVMGDRPLKSIVVLDPWLGPLDTSLIQTNIGRSVISI